MQSTAIVLARGGSRSLPDKNMQMLGDQTLLARCIRKCLLVFDHVVVSTDSRQVMRQTIVENAVPIKRPKSLAGDYSQPIDSLRHAMQTLKDMGDDAANSNSVSLVQCTAPFITAVDMKSCSDSALAATGDIHILAHDFSGVVFDDRGRSLVGDLTGKGCFRQSRGELWLSAGGCFSFRPEHLTNDLFTGTIELIKAQYPFYLDIDTAFDLEIARRLETFLS